MATHLVCAKQLSELMIPYAYEEPYAIQIFHWN